MFDYFYHFTSRQSIDNTKFGCGIFVDLKKSFKKFTEILFNQREQFLPYVLMVITQFTYR